MREVIAQTDLVAFQTERGGKMVDVIAYNEIYLNHDQTRVGEDGNEGPHISVKREKIFSDEV